MLRDLVEVFDFDAGVPILFRIKNDVGSLLAGAKAHVGLYFDVSERFVFNSLLKFGHEFL
jgi:hypothetical protein